MSDDLVTIYTSMDEIQAELIKSVLEGEGIQSFLENENQALIAGCIPVKVQVRTSDVQRAKEFIAQHEEPETPQEES